LNPKTGQQTKADLDTPGKAGDDAHDYQEKAVQRAIEEAKK
jgi:hypothetical protein